MLKTQQKFLNMVLAFTFLTGCTGLADLTTTVGGEKTVDKTVASTATAIEGENVDVPPELASISQDIVKEGDPITGASLTDNEDEIVGSSVTTPSSITYEPSYVVGLSNEDEDKKVIKNIKETVSTTYLSEAALKLVATLASKIATEKKEKESTTGSIGGQVGGKTGGEIGIPIEGPITAKIGGEFGWQVNGGIVDSNSIERTSSIIDELSASKISDILKSTEYKVTRETNVQIETTLYPVEYKNFRTKWIDARDQYIREAKKTISYKEKSYNPHPYEPISRVHYFYIDKLDSAENTINVRIQDFNTGAIIGPSKEAIQKLGNDKLLLNTYFVPNKIMQWYIPKTKPQGPELVGWPISPIKSVTADILKGSKIKWVYKQDFQRFKNGKLTGSTIYSSPAGTYAVRDTLKLAYDKLKGIGGEYGPPVSEAVEYGGKSFYLQKFESGYILTISPFGQYSKLLGWTYAYNYRTKKGGWIKI